MILDVFKLETLAQVDSFNIILRGLLYRNENDMIQFAQELDYIFDGFEPRAIYLHLEDYFVPLIRAYIKNKESV